MSYDTSCPGCGVGLMELHKPDCPVRRQELEELIEKNRPMHLSRKKAAELLAYTSEIINGERAQAYGEPQQSFEKIAKLWSTYLHTEITVTDVGMMMILLKVARNGRGKDKDDNFIDICGYASLAGSAVFKGKGE